MLGDIGGLSIMLTTLSHLIENVYIHNISICILLLPLLPHHHTLSRKDLSHEVWKQHDFNFNYIWRQREKE